MNIEDGSKQGAHRVIFIKGKGRAAKRTPVPLNPVVAQAVDRAAARRTCGPLLTNPPPGGG